MSLITIILFFVYIWGFGYSGTYFLNNSKNFFERNIMRLGIGIALFIVFGVFLNWIKVPLDWRIFLIISLIIPFYSLFRKIRQKKLEFKKIELTRSNLYILIVLVMVVITFSMYHKGAFIYPWLEDSDPWDHAKTAKYVSLEKTVYEPNNLPRDFFQYIDSYPPSYPLFMGILAQTTPRIMWTLKFFNALLLSLGLFFFYFFAAAFSKNRTKALLATFILFVIPCYMSHFIWSLTISVFLYFVIFYCLEKIKNDKRWWILSVFVIAALLLTQMTTAVKFSIFFGAYWVIYVLKDKKIHDKVLFAAILGLMLALLIWWGPMFIKWGWPDIVTKGLYQETTTNVLNPERKFYYGFSHFFYAPTQNKINNPFGLGPVLYIVLIASIVILFFNYKWILAKKYRLIILLWALLAFLMIHGSRLPIRMDPHRSWMLFAIPVALICGEGIVIIANTLKKIKIKPIIFIVILAVLLLWTSWYPKYSVNTAIWPHDGTSQGEIEGYGWIQTNIKPNTKIFGFGNYEKILAYDMLSLEWQKKIFDFRQDILNKNTTELHSFLKANEYKYFVFEADSFRKYRSKLGNQTEEILNGRVQEIASSPKFQVAHQTQGMVIFKVI